MTECDEEGVSPGESGKKQPRTSDYFRFWPIAFLGDFAGNPGKHSTKTEKAAYCTTLIWGVVRRPLHCRIAYFILLALAITLVFYWLKRTGYVNDDGEVVAAFTVVLAFVGLVQWWTTRHQLKAMRLDQRPWLAIKKPELFYARNDYEAKFEFNLTNHGKTPCAIRKSLYGVAFELDSDTAMSRAKSSLALRSANEGGVVPPGGTSEAVAVFPVNWTEEQLQAMTNGELYVAVAGIITYGRDELDAYETVFMFGTKTEFIDLVVLGGAAENYMS